MSTVLAIDTSTSQTCVALVENGKVLFNKSHLDPLAHGEILPKLVAQALKLNSKIDLVAVGMGPGPVVSSEDNYKIPRFDFRCKFFIVVTLCCIDVVE